ncbi:MAG: beta-ketoacyl-ACP synthase II [Nitrospirae bacterium]|nr:beta-ketoacyl-ACP synthase II [Nitrospirota bacterium]
MNRYLKKYSRRVVITGIGAVTPLANTFRESWLAVKNGISGIMEITRFDASPLPWKMAGEVKGFSPEQYLSPKETVIHDPFVHYAVASAIMAAEDSGLIKRSADRLISTDDCVSSAGVIIGSSRGGISTLESGFINLLKSSRRRRLSAYMMPSTTISMAASYIAQKLGARGVCLGISNACASGLNAIGESFRLIRDGYSDLMISGGTDAPICRFCIEGYGMAGVLSRGVDPSASRPFDRERDGFVLSEGACVFIMENLEHAVMRGVEIYGEIIAYNNKADAFHITTPDAKGEAETILGALAEGNVSLDDIDYINAHAASTTAGDKAEAAAIKQVFKEKTHNIPVSALKSMTGHMLAASGGFETACTIMSIREGVIPPTINLSERDIECDINIATELTKKEINAAMTNSFGFGGLNGTVVLKKYEAD